MPVLCSDRLPRRAFLFFCSFVAFLALSACSAPRESTLAITQVTVIDMTGAEPRPDQTLLIKKDRIAAIGASNTVAIPRGAQILDVRGKFLIPGLVDMHIHLTAAGEHEGSRQFILPPLITNGINNVLDTVGYLQSLDPLRQQIAARQRL